MPNRKEEEFYKKISPKLSEVLKLDNNDDFYKNYTSKIFSSYEIPNLDEDLFDEWLENRLKPNLIFIDFKEYLKVAIEALETYNDIALTDFGSSRKRDEAQLWADKIRGYLAEKAFEKKILKDFNIECKLPHESGHLKDYLDSDIPLIKKTGDKDFRKSKIKTSIKMTKWSGTWLDLGTQYSHSDIYVQIKVNTGTNHLMSFLKKIGFFENILLKKGVEMKLISDELKDKLINKIQNFDNLFAYIAGFKKVNDTNFIHEGELKIGRKWKKYHIKSAEGLLTQNILDDIKNKKNADKIFINPIEKFTTYPRYIIHNNKLKYKLEDWQEIIDQY